MAAPARSRSRGEGAQVRATDIDESLLERYAGTANVRVARLDVFDRPAIRALVRDAAATLDVLFNCAGIVHNGSTLDASDDDLDLALRLNVRAQLWTIQSALPGMLAAASGSIINMASIASSIKGLPNRCVYGISKAAVIGLTKAVAADYVKQGIRCNALCPGTVDTPSLGERIRAYDDPVAARRRLRRAPADGPARAGRGDRADGGLPGERRVEVRDRAGVLRRRRG